MDKNVAMFRGDNIVWEGTGFYGSYRSTGMYIWMKIKTLEAMEAYAEATGQMPAYIQEADLVNEPSDAKVSWSPRL